MWNTLPGHIKEAPSLETSLATNDHDDVIQACMQDFEKGVLFRDTSNFRHFSTQSWPFDTDEPTVPLRHIQCMLQVNKVKSLSIYRRGWVNIFYIH